MNGWAAAQPATLAAASLHGIPGDMGLADILDAIAVPLLVYTVDGKAVLANLAARDLLRLGDGALLTTAGKPGYQLFRADGVTPFTPDERPFALSASGQDVDSELVLVPDGATPRRLLTQCRAMRDADGQVTAVVITALDVTDLHHQHGLVSRHAGMFSVIGEASRAVLREDDARAAMCRAAVEVSDAVTATLMEPDGDELVATACHGADLVGLRVRLDRPSMVAEAFLSGRTRAIRDVTQQPQLSQALLRIWTEQAGGPMGGAVWVPVMDGDRRVGLLSVAFAEVIEDWGARVTALEILAGETAVAVERQRLLRQLTRDASTDGLTGAANRRAWDAAVKSSLNHARRSGSPLAVILLDLDRFKRYNDDHGHVAGDDLLRACVRAWSGRLRPGDLLCRWGGEEFAVLLPACPMAGASQIATTLRGLVPEPQTASAGVAVWDGLETADNLLTRADAALYAAKATGRNRTVEATTPPRETPTDASP